MKKKIILFAILICNSIANAQFNVTLNGKKVTSGQEFNFTDLKTLSVSFSNPEKLPPNIKGDLNFDCYIFDKNHKLLTRLSKSINGYAAVSVFLYSKTQKEYTVIPNKTPHEFEATSSPYGQFSDVCNRLKTDLSADKVTIEFSLQFFQLNYDSNGNQYFEQPVDVVEKFSFLLNIADKNAILNCTSLNASFKLSDVGSSNFKSVDSNYTWDKVKNISSNNFPKKINFAFEKFNIEAANFLYTNNKTADENLEEFKQLSEKMARIYANRCNKGLDIKEGERLIDLGIPSLFKFYTDQIVEKFDNKNNKNAEKEVFWEPFTLNGISGFKTINLLKTNTCPKPKGVIQYPPVDPASRHIRASCVVYVFKNPLNPKSILFFAILDHESRTTVDESTVKEKTLHMEKFISALRFTKQ